MILHTRWNYAAVADHIKNVVGQTQFFLLETWAEHLAQSLLELFKLASLTLTITKHPLDMSDVAGVGVTIERHRS